MDPEEGTRWAAFSRGIAALESSRASAAARPHGTLELLTRWSLRLLVVAFRLTPDARKERRDVFGVRAGLHLLHGRGPRPDWPAIMIPGFVVWPAWAVLVVTALLSLLGQPAPIVGLGAIEGLAISWFGASACGLAVSVLASTAGGIPMAIALATGYSMIVSETGGLSSFLTKMQESDALSVVVGGMAGVAKPPVLYLGAFVVAIATLAYSMGNASTVVRSRRWKPLAAILIGGTLGSAGVGLSIGAVRLVSSYSTAPAAMAAVLGITTGIAYAVALGIRDRAWNHARFYGLGYGCAVALLVVLAFATFAGHTSSIPLATGAHVLMHASFFVLSFCIAERMAGRWAGAWACAIEAISGYLGFVIARHGL